MSEKITSHRELKVYRLSFDLGMELFAITKAFPKEEKYSLTDQIRRSSRSITSNISEAWAKKKYIKSFVYKLTDSLGEEYETENWLEYSKDCKYIDRETYDRMMKEYEEIRKMLISMINNPDKFCKT
ncbi:MAG: four helix bundle protein [Bacteroidota bacterium]